MFKISKSGRLYDWLYESFEVQCKFLGYRDWVFESRKKHLEDSDFCRIVRVAFVWAPLAVVSNVVVLSGSVAVALFPFYASLNPAMPLLKVAIFLGMIIAAVAAVAGFVTSVAFLWEKFTTKRSSSSTQENFAVAAFKSVKSKFCPLVEFGE